MSIIISGPVWVGFAAFLWATDALIRYPAISKIDPTFIVLFEHVLAVLILLPWMYRKFRNSTFSLNRGEWNSAIFSGAGGSAAGTILFTASFKYINPSVAVLLQKLQPVLVVLIAYAFLGERPAKKFYLWGSVALIAGLVLSFPDLNFDFLLKKDSHSIGIQYALAAAFMWAAATVTGKNLLVRTPPPVATFWRFFFGLVAVVLIVLISRSPIQMEYLLPGPSLYSLLYMSLVPGLLAIILYYKGLSSTPAGVTAFIELVYPIGAIILNTAFLHTSLNLVQMMAGGVLLLAVAMLSTEKMIFKVRPLLDKIGLNKVG
ncbi:MAG: DMT family transporter [Bdellovibrionia bacterium]